MTTVPATTFAVLRPALRRVPEHELWNFRHIYRWNRDSAGFPLRKAIIWALAEMAILDFDEGTMSLTLREWRI